MTPLEQTPSPQENLPESLSSMIEGIQARMGKSADIIYRFISLGPLSAVIIFIEGLSEPQELIKAIHKDANLFHEIDEFHPQTCLKLLQERTLTLGKVGEICNYTEAENELLSGNTIVFIEGSRVALSAGTEALKQRGVEDAVSQSVVRGPREGFTESLRENTALIRRRIHNPKLRIEERRLGEQTHTNIAVMYIEGNADPIVLQELRNRLDKARLDSVLESNYIEEVIQDKHYSPFPTVYNTERPDVTASALLEGRIAILTEGTPFVLVVPALLVQFFQSSEDYYQRSDFASLVRLLRYFCFAVALLTPSFYIAITTFHQEMIPTTLLISLIGQREGIPFPAFLEAFIMEITFEVLREAGIRLPKSIGQSVSIVGTLVIGQAAVDAGLVSAAMVIVVSITAIANFALPAFNVGISVRMLRFVLMAIAASFGLYGMIIAMIMLGLHLCSLDSVGVPYMTSLAPMRWQSQKDTFIRVSRRGMKKYFGRN
ncbi:spore germination protein [Paenibacillus tritici]|uniref:Spore germination protein n=1 Tax=Paenibacillus tritici TaxID=1873425 RepID=A0ABX2DN31_9BACL|nr:spore germination protein [Paenibacillus tritici]NQX45850.1 spore germination protein [Paenibacillus tritici]QUL53919.1 spore germination protein [Paenibacillus tritici]